MKLFDYWFYWIARAYYKQDGKGAATAFVGLSVLQSFLVSAVTLPLIRVYLLGPGAPSPKTFGTIGVGILILLYLVNLKRYWNKYDLLAERWQTETAAQKRVGATLVVLAVPVVLALNIFLLWLTARR
ncbi:hypothetical protein LGH70_18195 [Hymenobacter sp. BT635]|uniref:DUF202 domain-containing protein n=1 Tax=Hymenobacter nitidus TaxID=2880929 RepID=A0ABS8AJ50_9BACT|nr:hypothetical protein [Hymenobacter nitidus]MCB2379534.1 hypothetical protein [Hymenobacter nitidus]